jgi:dTDP-glucose 4,6-dehydratase
MNILITGGSGFIGSNFIDLILKKDRTKIKKVVNLDALTYAANESNTKDFEEDEIYFFEKVDLCEISEVARVFTQHDITHVVHFAAESHVDNSISNPGVFIESNIRGTFNLLKVAMDHGVDRFHHVSTDEVYGDLGPTGKFDESTPYNPRNPYSASKASSDFLCRSYYHTYGMPITISNCSNNYGPKQHKEKFLPTIIRCILEGVKIPLYGNGTNIRDWIYVEDHCEGIWSVLNNGVLGETYCIGSDCEKENLDLIEEVCHKMKVESVDYIKFVSDRQGHDRRYAIDSSKIEKQLGWSPKTTFQEGIERTIRWYSERH